MRLSPACLPPSLPPPEQRSNGRLPHGPPAAARAGLPASPLGGRRVAVFEGRERARLEGIVRQQGGVAVAFPLVAIADAPDPEPVDRFLRALAGGGFDDLVLLTGEGLRRLLARAEVTGRGAAVREALGRV